MAVRASKKESNSILSPSQNTKSRGLNWYEKRFDAEVRYALHKLVEKYNNTHSKIMRIKSIRYDSLSRSCEIRISIPTKSDRKLLWSRRATKYHAQSREAVIKYIRTQICTEVASKILALDLKTKVILVRRFKKPIQVYEGSLSCGSYEYLK